MSPSPVRVCPVEHAGALDSRIRRWFQNPQKILKPYVKQGMTVMDFGCGPGFFTLDMAHLVGETGRVIAVDLQKGMLERLETKLQNAMLKQQITLHQCGKSGLNLQTAVDFIFSFYVVHEVPDQNNLLQEMHALLKPHGTVLIVEPPIHVSGKAFHRTAEIASACGFRHIGRPRIFFGKTALFQKAP